MANTEASPAKGPSFLASLFRQSSREGHANGGGASASALSSTSMSRGSSSGSASSNTASHSSAAASTSKPHSQAHPASSSSGSQAGPLSSVTQQHDDDRSTSKDRDKGKDKKEKKKRESKLLKSVFGMSSSKDKEKETSTSKAESSTGTSSGGPPIAGNTATPTTSSITTNGKVKGAVKDDWPMYSGKAQDYEMSETIGFGATSVVKLATYKPLNQVVAVKVMNFEGSASIRMMQREVHLMSLSKHPNILRVRGDWVAGSQLCIATRYIPPGSLLDIIEYLHPDGLDEPTCATILKQAAQGMLYLHSNGWLHRDIKAGNLLVDNDGTVLISDFGCSSQVLLAPVPVPLPSASSSSLDGVKAVPLNSPSMNDGANGHSANGEIAKSSNGNMVASPMTMTMEESVILPSRKSFVGTPCWMAPEVVEQKPYDSKADIWSFGITCIEIATGRAPHSLYTPAQILLKTMTENPPTLELEGQAHEFSKYFKEMIDTCLVKKPDLRPSADKILGHSFFAKSAKKKEYLVNALQLDRLPPLSERQTRRSRHSLRALSTSRAFTASVWDFETTPVTDQFRGFSMNNIHSTPSNSVSPSHSRTTSSAAPPDREAADPAAAMRRRSSGHSLNSNNIGNTQLSPASPSRRRNNSSSSQGAGSAHRRTISFDPSVEQKALESIREAGRNSTSTDAEERKHVDGLPDSAVHPLLEEQSNSNG